MKRKTYRVQLDEVWCTHSETLKTLSSARQELKRASRHLPAHRLRIVRVVTETEVVK